MNTAEKISAHKDGWGMNASTWTYRGVTMRYHQTTKRRSPWHAIAHTSEDWHRVLGMNKAQLMEKIDDRIDGGLWVVRDGSLYRNN